MHGTHCRPAKASVQSAPDHHYLSVIEQGEKTMNLIRNYRNWRRYRETVSELSRLSNRELNDLGIVRADIPAVASRGM